MDWCTFFSNIERDPAAITPRITIRQMLEAKNHLQSCDLCYDRSERVLAKEPKDDTPKIGFN